MISLAALNDKVTVGNDSGWLLAVHGEEHGVITPTPDLEIGREDYYAEIQATLPGGLEGGTYSITVEGLIDDHYTAIRKAKVAKLYLYWRDANLSVGGYLGNLTGLGDLMPGARSKSLEDFLVTILAIQSVTRKAGKRRYEATIVAREHIFDRLSAARLTTAITDQEGDAALRSLFSGFDLTSYELHSPLVKSPFQKGATATALLTKYASRLEESTGKRGRGMLLIRDGTLHIGPRPIPLGASKPIALTVAGGLIETKLMGKIVADPNHDPASDAPTRRQFQLILKGRPDIKPGAVVSFDAPSGDNDDDSLIGSVFAALPTGGGGESVSLYVSSVEHRLGRTSGFVTTVTGVTVDDDAWDTYSTLDGSTNRAVEKAVDASPAARAARAVHEAVRRAGDDHAATDIGEVRGVTTSGSEDPPSQTLRVWEGLAPDDGKPFAARRLAIARPGVHVDAAAPYATPFAWGKCGLVLPRYPGTRVVLTHRDARKDDPIDIGALWESATGPDSNAGDWWLILPVDVAENERSSLPDGQEPTTHTGKVTQDLIDADGCRIIEVGELTIRVGKDALASAGTRPAFASDRDCVRIEHTKGKSSITMKPTGEIEIRTDNKDLTFDVGSGTIKMTAATVDVSVSSEMNVH